MEYVAGSNTVSIINGTSINKVEDVVVGRSPSVQFSISINPNTNIAYVANYGSNIVSIIKGKTVFQPS